MKTKTELFKTLLEAGWTIEDIEDVLRKEEKVTSTATAEAKNIDGYKEVEYYYHILPISISRTDYVCAICSLLPTNLHQTRP